MLSKNVKRLILLIIDLIFSGIIWYINSSWGNDFITCLMLSTTTFLIVLIPFEVYWSFRDIWLDRWDEISAENVDKERLEIKVNGGELIASLYRQKNSKPSLVPHLIVVSPGFSDLKEDLEYFFLPFVNAGYLVLAYDARGTGESKSVGRRGDIKGRIDDFLKIVDWVQRESKLKYKELYVAGFSIGALTILCGGFSLDVVKKIFAVSSIGDFKKNIPRFNPIVWFRYFLKGIPQFPSNETNLEVSPVHVLNNYKQSKFSNSEEEWKKFSKKVMLVHVKNDKIVRFKNFIDIQNTLNLPEENQLILRKGGHVLKKNELTLVSHALQFFKSEGSV